MKPIYPDHSPHRVNIEKYVVRTEPALQQQIDNTDLGTAQQNPGDREQNAGNDQRNNRQGKKQRFERRIGALVQPSKKGTKRECEYRCPDRKLERIEEQLQRFCAAVRRYVILQRKFSGFCAGLRWAQVKV